MRYFLITFFATYNSPVTGKSERLLYKEAADFKTDGHPTVEELTKFLTGRLSISDHVSIDIVSLYEFRSEKEFRDCLFHNENWMDQGRLDFFRPVNVLPEAASKDYQYALNVGGSQSWLVVASQASKNPLSYSDDIYQATLFDTEEAATAIAKRFGFKRYTLEKVYSA